MGGLASKRKGYRGEANFVKLLQAHGIGAERVPLSGGAGGNFSGDVRVWTIFNELLFEGKWRKVGFRTLYKLLEPKSIDALFLKADHKPYLIVMPVDKFIELINEADRVE